MKYYVPTGLRSALVSFCVGVMSLQAAEFKLAGIFTDHAVLQRDTPVPVWGWADAGAEVTVEFAGQKKQAVADANGKWTVKLDPLKASAKSATLTVAAAQGIPRIVRRDILVGEVWLGSGQSNMGMRVSSANDFEKEKTAANLPGVRIFTQDADPSSTPRAHSQANWTVCTPETVGSVSATLFFFGREIHKALGVPVGLINSSRGGTSIELWIAPEAQRAAPALAPFFKSPDQPATNARAENQPVPSKARKRSVARALKETPGVYFNGRIAPLIPYAIRGVVWYQGEANAG